MALVCFLGAGALVGCDSELSEVDDPSDEAGLAAGKADGPLTDCEIDAIVALANDPATDFRAIGVTTTATRRIRASSRYSGTPSTAPATTTRPRAPRR